MAHSARHDDHVVNFELLRATRDAFHKFAFVPGGDPAMAGAPPGDPAAAGGAPPMDPAAMGMGGGGAPPMDPAAMGMGGGGAPPAPGGDPLSAILQKLNELSQAGGAGGAAGAGGAIKPKIDVNAVLLQILKIQARIADSLGIQIPASEMVPGQADMQQLAQATQSGQPMPGMDPTAQVGGGAPPGGGGAIAPIGPMPGSGIPGQDKAGSRFETGRAFDPGTTFDQLGDRVAAVAALFRAGAAR